MFIRKTAGRPGWRTLLVVALACALHGCGSIEHKPRGFAQAVASPGASNPSEKPRKIVIFFDGTANDEGSDTNVKRLHSLVTLQDRGDIASLYIHGVGTNLDPVGAATGTGINARVQIAYEFILNHYRLETADRKDEVYIFGFSRGAFAARILTTMLYFAGIVQKTKFTGEPQVHTSPTQCPPTDSMSTKATEMSREYTSTEIADAVHKAMFPDFGKGNVDESPPRPKKLFCDLAKKNLLSMKDINGNIPVPVKVLGLWDTVQALGVLPMLGQRTKLAFRSTAPDGKVDGTDGNVDDPNGRYGERLCNVEYAFQALSLDDNRATVFTPLLLSRSHLFTHCLGGKGYRASPGYETFDNPMFDDKGNIKKGHLQEVWFSGAHADVGGGYLNGSLNGVSLNWMLEQLNMATRDLLPKLAADTTATGKQARYVREDVLGGSHDPTAGIWGIYPQVTRNLVAYAFQKQSLWGAELCMHQSVFTRRSLIGYNQEHEYDQLALNAPGPVEVAPGPYGKNRNWQWLRERTAKDGPRVYDKLAVQQYPVCTFMSHATPVEKSP